MSACSDVIVRRPGAYGYGRTSRLRLVVFPLFEVSIEAIALHHDEILDAALEIERRVGEHEEEQYGQGDQYRADALSVLPGSPTVVKAGLLCFLFGY